MPLSAFEAATAPRALPTVEAAATLLALAQLLEVPAEALHRAASLRAFGATSLRAFGATSLDAFFATLLGIFAAAALGPFAAGTVGILEALAQRLQPLAQRLAPIVLPALGAGFTLGALSLRALALDARTSPLLGTGLLTTGLLAEGRGHQGQCAQGAGEDLHGSLLGFARGWGSAAPGGTSNRIHAARCRRGRRLLGSCPPAPRTAPARAGIGENVPTRA